MKCMFEDVSFIEQYNERIGGVQMARCVSYHPHPGIWLSHISRTYMQGHHLLKEEKAWGEGAIITVEQRSEPAVMSAVV